ncbi:hypothetical protein ACET8O_20445 [Aeromonas veronii]
MEQQKRIRIGKNERRVMLLEAAIKLSQGRQYQTLKMDELAKEGGCEKPVIYRVIGRKADVIKAIEEYAIEQGAAHKGALVVLKQMAAIGNEKAIRITME